MKTATSLFCLSLLTFSADAAPKFITGDEAVKMVPEFQAKADRMKTSVLGAKSNYVAAKGTHYHVSADGDDSRDGRSPETAIRVSPQVGSRQSAGP